MKRNTIRALSATVLAGLACAVSAAADTPPTANHTLPAGAKPLLDMNADGLKQMSPGCDQMTLGFSQDAAAPGIAVTVAPGNQNYPGLNIKPMGGNWDLSEFGHIEARVVNTGGSTLNVNLRVDNAGDWQNNPWNTEGVWLKPGQAGTIDVIFGYAYGHHRNYKLNPAAIVDLLMFTGKSTDEQTFRIESIAAAGPAGETPPIDPNTIRVKPIDGFLLGGGAKAEAKQIAAKGATAELTDAGLQATFPTAPGDEWVALRPAVGRWDLGDDLEIKVKLRNDGTIPVTPRVRLDTDGAPSAWFASDAPIAPGAQAEVIVPFNNNATADCSVKNSGSPVASQNTSGVTIAADPPGDLRALTIQSVVADLPPTPRLPDWLGKKPPVDGDWTKTLDDEFDGAALDTSIWSIQGANYWDHQSHWSKDEVSVGDGVVKLHYEKKRGFNNDDPKEKETEYAAGYLHTYGKWAQRYGYFEARIKMPTAPGLWPAFWMMPDRGTPGDPQWKRQMTEQGGMEFDIAEHLDIWGPNRYSIGMHWDGYGKTHKSNGSTKNYVQPDKDGYLTCGLLWTPGSAVYYCQGKEIARWENPRVADVPEMIMFTLPQGGWDGNSLNDDTKLPDDFTIDYVRVWQRNDLAEPGDGKKIAIADAAK